MHLIASSRASAAAAFLRANVRAAYGPRVGAVRRASKHRPGEGGLFLIFDWWDGPFEHKKFGR